MQYTFRSFQVALFAFLVKNLSPNGSLGWAKTFHVMTKSVKQIAPFSKKIFHLGGKTLF